MLRLYLGRAGSGKTSYILGELGSLAAQGQEGNILIVPEQYSHDCERALAALGDDVCLYAQVLSFSRLASRVFSETGGIAEPMLDAGGRTLAMSLAYMQAAQNLKVYDVGSRRPDFVSKLLEAYDELRAAGTGISGLSDAAREAEGTLGDKLEDLALIFQLFEGVKERSGMDTRDRLERLAAEIGKSSVGNTGRVFLDGFTDFTWQEMRVLEELLRKGADVTVSIGAEDLTQRDLTFRLPVRTAASLMSTAGRLGVQVTTRLFPETAGRHPALRYMERNLTDYAAPPYEGEAPVRIIRAGAVSQECEIAAARCLELVRRGERFRDIAVVSPDFQTYAPILEGVFRKYGVASTYTHRSDILEKPAMALIVSALDAVENGFDYQSVFKYLKTGLAGVDGDGRDLLENYVLKWNIRGESMWTREWTMMPGGYGQEPDEDTAKELLEINALRERVAGPLVRLRAALSRGGDALEYARALYGFLEEIGLYGQLEEKSLELQTAGRLDLAGEYRQLWDIIVGALEQFCQILGSSPMERGEFARLLKLVLGQYTVGVIPASVDSVRTGDMGRVRARGIRHLIVLGAVEDALPPRHEEAGVFSQAERRTLIRMGLHGLEDREDETARDLALVYNSLTVPTRSLMLTYPDTGRKSYVVSRLEKLLNIPEEIPSDAVRAAAAEPAFELAASGEGDLAAALRAWFKGQAEWGAALEALDRAASAPRGRLTGATASRLYGGKLRLSASQIDKYYACRYAYFLQYGLRAKPRQEAALDAPEAGTFMHFILERVAAQIREMGGFNAVERETVSALIPPLAEEYVNTRLGGLEGKGGRFRYLFTRLVNTARKVALNLYDELKDSDFRPLDFELKFAPDGDLPPVTTGSGDSVVGAVDRVDGWIQGDKLYIRVVDYKTGKKTLNLRDVLSGVGLQMLIYLFALEREGSSRYGRQVVPAGVLYAPAREELVKSDRDLQGEELELEREKLLKYSGLVLADPLVLEAMERGTKKRLPVSVSSRTGELRGSLADAQQLGHLAARVDQLVSQMADEVRRGSINANPYLRGKFDSACLYCDYYDACHFVDGTRGESYRRAPAVKPADIWQKIEEAGKNVTG